MLEGSDKLLRSRLRNLHHIQVEIDPPVHALDFTISDQQRRTLFLNGEKAFHSYHARHLRPFEEARNPAQKLQALYCSPDLIEPILELVATTIEGVTNAGSVRASVMLPTLRSTSIIVYQHGMDGHSDGTWETSLGAGCNGAAYQTKKPAYADLIDAQTNYEEWDLSAEEQALIPKDRAAMISVPIFDTSEIEAGSERVSKDKLSVIGTLNVDTTTLLDASGWIEHDDDEVYIVKSVLDFLETWADIVGKLLS